MSNPKSLEIVYGTTAEQHEAIVKAVATVDFEPIKKKTDAFIDAIRDRVWEDVQAFVESDTVYNIRSNVADRVRAAVFALLKGDKNYTNAWVFDVYEIERVNILRAIYEHNKDRVENETLKLLAEENERLREDLKWHREHR